MSLCRYQYIPSHSFILFIGCRACLVFGLIFQGRRLFWIWVDLLKSTSILQTYLLANQFLILISIAVFIYLYLSILGSLASDATILVHFVWAKDYLHFVSIYPPHHRRGGNYLPHVPFLLASCMYPTEVCSLNFHWLKYDIPILPISLNDFLQAPTPFIMGLHADYYREPQDLTDVCIFKDYFHFLSYDRLLLWI